MNKDFFKTYQRQLLWLLNTPLIKHWFRWVLRIDCKKKIAQIQPNNYKWYDGRFHADFRTHNKYSKRLYHAFYPLWWLAHQWDMLIANPFNPAWNLGFDTLTVFPDADPETTTVDGRVSRYTVDETLATIRAGAGNSHNDTGASGTAVVSLTASTTSNQYSGMDRMIMLFDTSSLTASASISSVVLSEWITARTDGLTGATSANSALVVVASTPASNTDLVDADFSQVGTTDFGRSGTQSSMTDGAYTDITLNASGISAISKTGVSKFALRYGWDFDNTTTGITWASSATQDITGGHADQAGTTQDPKLVVTYTLTSATINKTYLLL